MNRPGLIRSRRSFYRDNYRRACIGLMVMLLTILLLSGFVIYLAMTRPTANCYATDTDGRVIHLNSRDSPIQTADSG